MNLAKFDLIVTNPPFTYAEQFIEKAHGKLTPNGIGLFLCKYSIAACLRRREMWKRVNLREIWMLVPRPSFYGGSSDACEYCYFIFDAGPVTDEVSFYWLMWKETK